MHPSWDCQRSITTVDTEIDLQSCRKCNSELYRWSGFDNQIRRDNRSRHLSMLLHAAHTISGGDHTVSIELIAECHIVWTDKKRMLATHSSSICPSQMPHVNNQNSLAAIPQS
jgi:ribosomal protein L31